VELQRWWDFLAWGFCWIFCLFVWDSVSLCSPGWPWTCDPLGSISKLLGLHALLRCVVFFFFWNKSTCLLAPGTWPLSYLFIN
jgi:hypothetical protein